MSAALAEPLHVNTSTNSTPSAARAEASRANGRRSRGPTTPEGKERSRRNGCKEGLTGAGTVLPQAAAAEVERREAELARDFRPRNAVERELVRQMALGSWRSEVLGMRIVQHDARMNAARFANWEQDERIAAVEIGRRLGDDPEAAVTQLRRTTSGCDWLIGRWRLLGNGLSTTEDGGPDCSWTDADLALALNLLGCPAELRHLDEWTGWLEGLRDRARSGSEDAVTRLREIIDKQIAGLDARDEEIWEAIEEPQLRDWQAGVDIDMGVEGTRLRRYEAAADRLFRSAWRKLEQLRNERGEPLMPRREREPYPEPAARYDPAEATPPVPPPPARVPVRPEPVVGASSPRVDPATTVLDFWVAGPPRPGMTTGFPVGDKTNPTRGRQERVGRAAVLENLSC
jgi:hypothetical protein